MLVDIDIYLTMAMGIAALALGIFINEKIPFLKRICIPAPVSGGIIFSVLTLLFHSCFDLQFSFDGTLKDVCMVGFFTSVGFQSNVKVIKDGGRPLIILLILIFLLIVIQNLSSVGIASALGLNPLLGMTTGSIPMCGGHGTAAGFSGMLEDLGIGGASSIAMAAATFGLLSGSLLGGPLAFRLITKNGLKPRSEEESGHEEAFGEISVIEGKSSEKTFRSYTLAVYEIFAAVGLGTLMSKLLALTDINFPTYFGALIVAALIRNFTEIVPSSPKLEMNEITSVGNICLSLFLGMAMISLRLWELSSLAVPMLAMLSSQVLIMWLFARFLAFPLLGGDYDAALLVSGMCGFGLGATPNAMANMSAVCNKHGYSPVPFLIVPVVGAMFVDIINISIITVFINIIS